ncbi:unnamed protein product [Scytosiphon promiscuus]
MAQGDQGTSRRASSLRAGLEESVTSVMRRRGGISHVLKTLGINKVEDSLHVNVGKDRSSVRASYAGTEFPGPDVGGGSTAPEKHTLGVSLLGACSSKGCPTKSAENEDRYAHGKINLDMKALQGLGGTGIHKKPSSSSSRSRKSKTSRASSSCTVPCWAFATFDGHAGPACAHFLKENFMSHLRKNARARCKVVRAAKKEAHRSRDNVDADAPGADGEVQLGASYAGGSDTSDDAVAASSPEKASPAVEVVLARLLTETLASLTREFEKDALSSGEISGACVISGLYCQGALVLANVGDCQAVYHGQVKSAPGSAVTAQTTVHDATNPAEVNRFLMAGGFMSSTGRFQGVLEPSRTVGDVDVKADAPKGCIASFPELFKVDIASEVFRGDEKPSFPPFLVLATDGIWDETCPNTVVDEVKDGIARIQAHKRRFAVRRGKGKHRRDSSFGSTTFTDGESDSEEDASEFCGSGEWAEQGMDLAERVVSLARGRYDDATALVVVFE